MNKDNIKAAILQARGRVVTHRSLICGCDFLRMLTAKAFLTATTELHQANLGYLVEVKFHGRASNIFIKKTPAEVTDILESHPEYGTSAYYYATRFMKPTPNVITMKLRTRLIELGLVPLDFCTMNQTFKSETT